MDYCKLNGVYKISCKKNNKVYIGESHDIITRWQEHIISLQNKTHHSYKLQSDFNTHGVYNFSFEVIELLDK